MKSEQSVGALDLLAFLDINDEIAKLMSFGGRRRSSLSR